MPDPKDLLVGQDERGFYGHDYFVSHQVKCLGHPAIAERARLDLPERCAHWLRALLKHKLPPAKVLELGSSHGGFVALMRWAGYDATGLDLSPWVVDFARKTFGVPMLQGPIEEQSVPPQSLDAVVLMDVLEHLPDPVNTLRHCVRLLKPEGILLIQTPSYTEGKSLQEMIADGDSFVNMLRPDSHLHLFSQRSVAELLRRLGVGHVRFEPAIFSAYDMFLVGTMAPASVFAEERIHEALSAAPAGPLVRALLDLKASFENLNARYAESEIDRANRLQVVAEQGQRLAAQDAAMNRLWERLEELQAPRANAGSMRKLPAEPEADRTERLQKVEAPDPSRGEPEAGPTGSEAAAGAAGAEGGPLDSFPAGPERRSGELDEELASKRRALEDAQLDLRSARDALERLRASHVYRLMRQMGLWQWLDQAIVQVAPGESAGERPSRGGSLERVVVDLTPVLPGGDNGGAKLMTIELLRHLSRLAEGCQFILLTSEASHDELAFLDSPNMRRLCVRGGGAEPVQPPSFLRIRQRLARILPPAMLRRLGGLYRAVERPDSSSLPSQLEADVVFCPFTAPFFYDPRVPVVSVIYDLQYVYHPHFFDANDRAERERHLRAACSVASRLVCISEHVRQTVLANTGTNPKRVETIHISLPNRVSEPSAAIRDEILGRYGLEAGGFLLYPANFWLHKNHEALLTAFGIYRAEHPDSKLKLVLTGAPGKRMDYVREAARRMALDRWVVFGGHLPDDEYAALLFSSLALILPSLYEGFGMPVLEAMAAGKPVLCSNTSSLPEIAGDAALLFDPRKPAGIAEAIARIAADPECSRELVIRGYERAASFGGPEEMASRYLRIFREVAGLPAFSESLVYGVFPDGWASGHLMVTLADGPEARKLLVELHAPEWSPVDRASVRVLPVLNGHSEVHSLRRGQTLTIERELPPASGLVEITIHPLFQPRACGAGPDTRWIGCRFGSARILSPDGNAVSIEPGSNGV